MSWQEFRVVREEGLTHRFAPVARRIRRWPALVAVGLLFAGVAGTAAVSSAPSVVERCDRAGLECPRFTDPAAPEVRLATSCFAEFRAAGRTRAVSSGFHTGAASAPVYVTSSTRLDPRRQGEVARVTTTPLGEAELSTPPVRGHASAPRITLGTGATWYWADLGSVDRWLDQRDGDVLGVRRSTAGDSAWDAMLAVRTGAEPEVYRRADVDVTIEPVTGHPLVPGGLGAPDRRGPKERAMLDGYPRVDISHSQVVTSDHRPEAQHEVRTSILYSVPALPAESGGERTGALDGVGVLTVVSRRGDRDTTRVTGIEVVHASTIRGKELPRDVGSALEGSTASLVTTVRIDVDATNRETLLDWLRVVDDERPTGQVRLPPNLLDPALPVARDRVQSTLYHDATVVRELRAGPELRGEAAVLAWAGVYETDETSAVPLQASQLLDRSPDGVRRAVRPLSCGDGT